MAVRQFPPALRGVGEKRADAAFDIDPAVRARGAGGGGQRIEFLLALHQCLGKRLQHHRPFVERHAAERRPALFASIGKRSSEIDAAGIDERHRRAGRSVAKGHAVLRSAHPGAGDIAFEPARPVRHYVHRMVLPSVQLQRRLGIGGH